MKVNKKYEGGGKRRRKKTVDYSTPYQGSMGKSMDREIAKRKWQSSASPDEMQMGYTLTQDADGNFIARTKMQSTPKYFMGGKANNNVTDLGALLSGGTQSLMGRLPGLALGMGAMTALNNSDVQQGLKKGIQGLGFGSGGTYPKYFLGGMTDQVKDLAGSLGGAIGQGVSDLGGMTTPLSGIDNKAALSNMGGALMKDPAAFAKNLFNSMSTRGLRGTMEDASKGNVVDPEKDAAYLPQNMNDGGTYNASDESRLTRRGRKQKYNTRPGSAYNPEGEFFNPEKQRFARNVKKANPNQIYNLMRDIQEQRVMEGSGDMDVTESDIQRRLNRQAIPKTLLAMMAAGLLGKSAGKGKFASLIGQNRGAL